MIENDLTQIIYNKYREIVKRIFPDIFISNTGYAGWDFYARQSNNNYLFRDTKYFYNGELKFVHWTSLNNLLSILNYRNIRLYNLYNSDDIDEFTFSASALGFNQQEIDNSKNYYYTFSFCEKQNLDNEYLWELYGKKYNGVAIEFSIINEPAHWDNYFMSKVYYEIPQNFTQFNEEISNLKKQYNAKFNLDIQPLIGFHKRPDYVKEN